ncbi:hypothetical protein [Brunnivagina elsteri]|uniref:hypothetical protein n=1 Tax=Brunnivagina elsteri TaxID=1247191 RepID=UPI001B806358|nr:hypothetical protein [Calothrix elsteri]
MKPNIDIHNQGLYFIYSTFHLGEVHSHLRTLRQGVTSKGSRIRRAYIGEVAVG